MCNNIFRWIVSAVTSKPATDGHSKTSQVEGVKIGIGWSKNNVFL